MRKKILTVLLALSALSASAQHLFFQVGGGFSSHCSAAGSVVGAKGGLGWEWEFDQRWSFAPLLSFMGKGWQDRDGVTPDLFYDNKGNPMLDENGQHRQHTDKEGKPVFSTMHRSYSADYLQLELPVHYYLRMGNHRYLRFTGGAYAALGVGGRRRTEGDGRASGGRKVNYTDPLFKVEGMKRFDVGLKMGIAYQFPTAVTMGLETDFGILPINRVTPELPKIGKNISGMLTITYHFWRNK